MASNDRRERPEPNARWWVKLFVAFHILAVTIWALPNPHPDYLAGKEQIGVSFDSPGEFVGSLARTITDGFLVWNAKYAKPSFLRFYTLGTGFWQYWDMFAPNPSSVDLWGSASVIYADGTETIYNYPRMADMGYTERYLRERYRKFFERTVYSEYLWPPFTARVALLMTKRADNPVTSVTLWKHTLGVPPPGQRIPERYVDFDFFRADRNGRDWRYFVHRDIGWVEVKAH